VQSEQKKNKKEAVVPHQRNNGKNVCIFENSPQASNMKERIITPIKDINPMIANMAIKGRCIPVWHSHKLNEIRDPYSLDCVFQDEECYIISNFGVAKNNGRLPLLPNRWKISFYKGTEVTRVDQIDDNLIGFVNEPFSYVIGTVVSIGNIVPINGYGFSKVRKTVVIEDTHYEANNRYNANEFKIRIHNLNIHVVTLAKFMVGMIRDIESETYCVVYATIHSIQYENRWAYSVCKACNTKVTTIQSKLGYSSRNKKQLWHCKNHGETYSVVSRFKIIFRIFDESGSTQIVLFDNNVYKMIKLSAWQIMEEQGMDTNQYFPGDLNQIIGKQYLFKLSVVNLTTTIIVMFTELKRLLRMLKQSTTSKMVL
nr:replication protein A 70 kDa DNA-binding subunit B [Tanacetum cinerariifolium]